MKRQSTTAKITLSVSRRIMAECQDGSGVIVRHRGVEFGVVSVIRTASGYVANTLEGVKLVLSGCTIRKTTNAPEKGHPLSAPATMFTGIRRTSIILIQNGFTFDEYDRDVKTEQVWQDRIDSAAHRIGHRFGFANNPKAVRRVSSWILGRLEREIGFMKSK